MQTKIIVTYNFPICNHWRQILSSFVGDLLISGLYEKANQIIFFTKTNDYVLEIESRLFFLPKIKFIYVPDGEFSSMSQLRFISEHARSACYPTAYLYASARGVSYDLRKDFKKAVSVFHWAKMLNYFSLFDHQRALEALKNYDAVGTNWVPVGNRHRVPPHFQGLGWWANGAYLARLPEVPSDRDLIKLLADDPIYAQKPGKNPGWGLWGEFWIGFGNPKVFEQFSAYDKFANSLNWHYVNPLHESSYDASYIAEHKS